MNNFETFITIYIKKHYLISFVRANLLSKAATGALHTHVFPNGITLAIAKLEPGWHWGKHVKPIAKTFFDVFCFGCCN